MSWVFTGDGVTEVDRYGNVRRGNRIIKQSKDRYGYSVVNLKTGVTPVHRLVAIAFVRRPDGEVRTVNHKDGVKANNMWTNLEWSTHKEQMEHARDNRLMDATRMYQVVDAYDHYSGKHLGRFESQWEAARHFGFSSNSKVSAVLLGKRNHHKGITFRRADIS